MQQEATYATNRIDLFTKRWMGGDSDEIRRRFIRYNFDFFRYSPTFWLPVGRLFWITAPSDDGYLTLAIDGRALVLPGDRTVGLPPQV